MPLVNRFYLLQKVYTKYAAILSYLLIQALNSAPISYARQPKRIPRKEKTPFVETVAAYTVVACGSPQNAHANTRTHVGWLRRSWIEWYRETKLPPILFSKPIISSRASDFVRVTARNIVLPPTTAIVSVVHQHTPLLSFVCRKFHSAHILASRW